MNSLRLLAIVLAGGCVDPSGHGPGGGGKGDNPNGTFTDVTTAWEMVVGYAGDAVVNKVSELPGGSVFVTSSFPRWLIKATGNGDRDTTFGRLYPGSTTTRSGSLDLTAHDIWQVDPSHVVASVGDGLLYELDGFLADGTPDPAFGNAGRALLPYSDGKPLRVVRDAQGHRFLVVVARAWEISGSYNKGPSQLEVLAYDEATGAKTSAGVFDMPPWANQGTSPADIHQLVLQPDGSFLLIADETLYTSNPARADVATRWSAIRLAPGAPVTSTELLVTGYSPRVAGFVNLGAGHFDLYLAGEVDGLSVSYNEQKLVRVTLDDAGAPEVTDLGVGPDFTSGVLDPHGCPQSVATSDGLLFGHSLDRSQPIQFTMYPKSGSPVHFASDLPRRCLTSLNVTEGGRIYAGTWDTTNAGWTAQLTSFQ